MSESETEAQYKQEFMERVAEARIARGWKQWEMSEALGIPQDQYKQYETRGMMPHRYMWRFCQFARIDIQWLLTGKGPRTVKEPPEFTPDISPAPKARQRPSKRSIA